jgi:hypothetical protein
MTLAMVYLVLAASGAVATFIAASNGRRPPRLGALYWLIAWFVVELPWHHLALSLLVTAGVAALGAFQYWPAWVGLALVIGSWPLLLRMAGLGMQAHAPLERALQEGLGADYQAQIPAGTRPPDAGAPLSAWLRPFRVHDHVAVERVRDIAYGPAGVRNQLDVYRPRGAALRAAPVLLQIHGGAWVFGEKDRQGLPLMNEMARRGWVCVAINYRLSPKATFPDHLIDCKHALAWVRNTSPTMVATRAGWRLPAARPAGISPLLALTANDPEYQPGFEAVDTSIQAAVPFYGAYDFLQHNGVDIRRSRQAGLRRDQGDEVLPTRGAPRLGAGLTHPLGATRRAPVLRHPRRSRLAGLGGGRARLRGGAAAGFTPAGRLCGAAGRAARLRHLQLAALPAHGAGGGAIPRLGARSAAARGAPGGPLMARQRTRRLNGRHRPSRCAPAGRPRSTSRPGSSRGRVWLPRTHRFSWFCGSPSSVAWCGGTTPSLSE